MKNALYLLAVFSLLACGSGADKKSDAAAPIPTAAVPAAPLVTASAAVDVRPAVSIDARVSPLVQEYLADAKAHGVEVSPAAVDALRTITIDPVLVPYPGSSDDTLAYCQPFRRITSNGIVTWKEIHIHEPSLTPLAKDTGNYAVDVDNLNFKTIVYHELTHCFLNKGHSHLNPLDLSVMAAVFIPLTTDGPSAWESMVDQLFSPQYLSALPAENVNY